MWRFGRSWAVLQIPGILGAVTWVLAGQVPPETLDPVTVARVILATLGAGSGLGHLLGAEKKLQGNERPGTPSPYTYYTIRGH